MITPKIPVVQFFQYAHLPERLQDVSRPFSDVAAMMIKLCDESGTNHGEVAAGLRKLLEAKDCAVRAAVAAKT
jgi:hypothetical protein